MKNINYKRILTFCLLTFFSIVETFARPGGGSSYSGGGGGGGSSWSGGGGSSYSGGGGSGEFSWGHVIIIIIFLTISYFINKAKEKKRKTQIVSNPTFDNRAAMNRQNEVDSFKQTDPNFSKTLFIDFANSLFMKYYAFYNKEEFKNLAPFFTKQEMQKQAKFLAGNDREISEIVIGSSTINFIKGHNGGSVAAVDFDANFTVTSGGKRTRYGVTERWQFMRMANALSTEPGKMRELSCPNCGAAANFTDSGECQSCGTAIVAGQMQWSVASQSVMRQEVFKSGGLAHYSPEVGTNFRTIKSNSLVDNSNLLSNMHGVPVGPWFEDFKTKIVTHYFKEIYTAWSANDLSPVRAMLSDRLYDSFMFWIDEYKSQGLTNILSGINISKIETANIDIDAYYESITIRVYASAKDYVLTQSGTVAGGSSSKPREFSEYWTFVRSRNATKEVFDTSTCPNCGAPADKMGQAGVCEYCNTKISNGDFSWVLSVITQDEVYMG